MMAKTKAILLAFILTQLVSSCVSASDSQDKTPQPEDMTMTSQHIDVLNLTLDLPDGLIQRDTLHGSMFCFDEERYTRYLRCFSVVASASFPTEDIVNWQSEPLTENGVFYYHTKQTNEGSGGPSESLEGYMVIGEYYFRVRANTQQESGAPDATWVIPIIQTARYVEAGSR